MKNENKKSILVDVALDASKPGLKDVILCFRREDNVSWGYRFSLAVGDDLLALSKVLDPRRMVKEAKNLPDKPPAEKQ